jgi:hypothetical protein
VLQKPQKIFRPKVSFVLEENPKEQTAKRKERAKREERAERRRERKNFGRNERRERNFRNKSSWWYGGVRQKNIDILIFTKCTVAFQK